MENIDIDSGGNWDMYPSIIENGKPSKIQRRIS